MTTPPDNKPYDPNQPPRANSSIGQAQFEFQNNFSKLFNAFKKDHVSLDAASNAGNHTVIELLQQTGDFQTNIDEINIYSKKASRQTAQLFLRQQNNANEIQLTNYQIYSLKSTSKQIEYFTFLPGGIVVYFGTVFNRISGNIINLRPAICRRIISVVLCPNQPTPSYPSWVEVQALPTNVDRFYETVKLNPPERDEPGPSVQDYIILGNI